MATSSKRFQVIESEVYGDGSRIDCVLASFDTKPEADAYKAANGRCDQMHHTYVHDTPAPDEW